MDQVKTSFTITPRVDEAQEFIEIANDFADPLDLVREAISNAFDAQAREMHLDFNVMSEYGESVLVIDIQDDGTGMTKEGLQAFFDLGNSLHRGDTERIGEKGHGTKVYFNSHRVEVWTRSGDIAFFARLDDPYRKLFDREIPQVHVEQISPEDVLRGTRISIRGYNNNRRDRFTHNILRDHILWFTKFGNVEVAFQEPDQQHPTLWLKGLDRESREQIPYGHPFPDESSSMQDLFDRYLVSAPHLYCKRITRQGSLPNFPEISYDAVFSIEGNHVKYAYNPMLRRSGYAAPRGAYRVQDRYGLWICKDYIPIQQKNTWLPTKRSEYTRLHAFVNCQALSLTANRGSIDNTPAEILDDLQHEVKNLYLTIVDSDDWRELEWLEQEATGYRTAEKERRDFAWRQKRVSGTNVAEFRETTLVEPTRESGVFTLFIQVSTLKPDAFPFHVVDYDTHEGIDVIAKGDSTTPIQSARLFYVEFKQTLQKEFNHSFENLHSVVCWDTALKQDDIVSDIGGAERKMRIALPEQEGERTRYFLDQERSLHRIEVFVLKDFLREELGLEFRPRLPEARS